MARSKSKHVRVSNRNALKAKKHAERKKAAAAAAKKPAKK